MPKEAHRWKCLLEDDKYRPAGENAEAEAIRSFVNRLLRLTSLASDIVEAISVAGSRRDAAGGPTRSMLTEWPSQRDLVAPDNQ